MSAFNIYCDESCHLENDKIATMGFGAVWFPTEKKEEIFKRISEIKMHHGINPWINVKWHKASPSKEQFFLDLIDYFFDDDHLHFRCLLVPDKGSLNHSLFNQTHDDFYYKMYFDLLKIILAPNHDHNIFLDIKDSNSNEKVERLKQYLNKTHYAFDDEMIKKFHHVRSREVHTIQLVDILLGAVVYNQRGLQTSQTKLKIIKRIKERSGYSLEKSTLPKESKFNYFIWRSGGSE